MNWDGHPDRRRYERIAARMEVRFGKVTEAARALRAYSLNFSAGGLCLKTQRQYAVGDTLSLEITVEGSEFHLTGAVAWVRQGAIGVRFENVSEEDRLRLSHVLAAFKR